MRIALFSDIHGNPILQRVRHPAADFITRFMRGQYQYDWEQQSVMS